MDEGTAAKRLEACQSGSGVTQREHAMLPAEIQSVVGIDVAKQAHVVCALEAPSGAVLHKPSRIEATAEGYALLYSWLGTWGAPEQTLIGLEATGPLWEPLYEHLTQAGYRVLLLNPRQTASWASSLGLRARARWAGCADPGHRLVGGLSARQHPALRVGSGVADPDPRPA
jgi:Transposase